MKKIDKRYDKFKNNNLPTPFWDTERQTLEYVYFNNGKPINFEEAKGQLKVSSSLVEALGEIVCTGFCYPFTSKPIYIWEENSKTVRKEIVRQDYAHSFEEVVKVLYDSPESFSISKDEEKFYSIQELEYLRRVQKYLLFIGMKDLETRKASVSRYRNKIHSKYENALIYTFNDQAIKDIIEGKRNFKVDIWYPDYSKDEEYKPKEYRALIVDKEDNFKMFVEFTKREVKKYKDISSVCNIKKLKDDDKVVVTYFKILEKF